MLVDEIELGDELAEELAGDDTDVALEAGGDLGHEPIDELTADLRLEPHPVAGRVDLPQPRGDGAEPLVVEGGEFQLCLSGAREASLLEESDPVVKRGEASHSVTRVEEVGRAGEEP